MHRSAKLLAIGILVVAILSCGSGRVSPSGDFTVNGLPSSVTIQPGGTIISTFIINPENGFNGRITLTVTGIPEGLTLGPTPSQVTGPGTCTMTWSAAPDLALGTYTITFLFTSGHLQHSYNVVAQVQ
jgi:hypothetical protein